MRLISLFILALFIGSVFAITDCEICQSLALENKTCSYQLVDYTAWRLNITDIDWKCLAVSTIYAPGADDNKPVYAYSQENKSLTLYTIYGNVIIYPDSDIVSWSSNYDGISDTLNWTIEYNASPSRYIKKSFDMYYPFIVDKNGSKFEYRNVFFKLPSNIPITRITDTPYGQIVEVTIPPTNSTYNITGYVGKLDACSQSCTVPGDALIVQVFTSGSLNVDLGSKFIMYMYVRDTSHSCKMLGCTCTPQTDQTGSWAQIPVTNTGVAIDSGGSSTNNPVANCATYTSYYVGATSGNAGIRCNQISSGKNVRTTNSLASSAGNAFSCIHAYPVVTISAPTNNSYLSSYPVQVNCQATSSHMSMGDGYMKLYDNRTGSYIQQNSTCYCSSSPCTCNKIIYFTTNGNYSIRCGAWDDNGYNTNSTIQVNISATSPSVYLVSPANSSVISINQSFTFYATDNVFSTLSCSLRINGVVNYTNSSVLNNTNTTTLVSFSSSQNDSWYVNCTNGYSLVGNSSVWNFSVVLSPPSVYLVYPTNHSTIPSTQNFTFYAKDNIYSTLNCSLYINGVLNYTNSSVLNNTNTTTWNTFNSTQNDTWYVSCINGIGLSSTSSTWNFYYRQLATPFVYLVTPLNNSNTLDEQEFKFYITDEYDSSITCTSYMYSPFLGSWFSPFTSSTISNNTNTSFYIYMHSQLAYGSGDLWFINCTDSDGLIGYSEVRTFNWLPYMTFWTNDIPTWNSNVTFYSNVFNSTLTNQIITGWCQILPHGSAGYPPPHYFCSYPAICDNYSMTNTSILYQGTENIFYTGKWSCWVEATNGTIDPITMDDLRVVNGTVDFDINCPVDKPVEYLGNCYSQFNLTLEQSTQCFGIGDTVLLWANITNTSSIDSVWLFAPDNTSYKFSYSIAKQEYFIWYRVKQQQEVLTAESFKAPGVADAIGEVTITYNPCPYTAAQNESIWVQIGMIILLIIGAGLMLVFIIIAGTIVWGLLFGRKKKHKDKFAGGLDKPTEMRGFNK